MRSVDGASLAAFRIGFGAALFTHAASRALAGVFSAGPAAPARVIAFAYPGLEWVPALTPVQDRLLHAALACVAVALAAGLRARVAATVACALQTLAFLQDAAAYNNHEYLLCLLCAVLAVVPANVQPSLGPSAGQAIPVWALWLVRYQIGLVYVFGGLAKIDPDWLMRAEPLRTWLAEGDVPAVLRAPGAAYLLSWGGLVLDLAIVPLLLHARTRAPAFVVVTAFHVANALLFDIGVFPWLMIAATTVFFEPDWPRHAWRLPSRAPSGPHEPDARPSRWLVAAVSVLVVAELALPLRHLAYPGVTAWTDQGHRLSWRMKLRDKRGTLRFEARSRATGEPVELEPPESLLPPPVLSRVMHDPELIRQLGRALGERARERTGRAVQVFALTAISLNAHPVQPLVRTDVDLMTVSAWTRAEVWIEPFRGDRRWRWPSPRAFVR